jgi:DNA-binding MarR family transcriptional regulator
MSEATKLASDLRVVIGQLVRRLRAERRELSLSQVTVLGLLDRSGAASISDLAAADRVRPQSMASTVAAMEAAGLLARAADTGDRRRVVITMTAAGRAALADDRARRVGWLAAAIERDLGARERRELARAVELLRRLAEDERPA